MQQEYKNNEMPSKQSFLQKAKEIYMNSPVNFSLITGWRYPGIPRLTGNPILGRLLNLLSDNGILKNLLEAAKLATEHPSGMCYYWLANKLVLLVTKPEDIEKVLIINDENVSRRSATKFMESFLGPNIATDQDNLWKQKKQIYIKHFAGHEALRESEPTMQAIVCKYVQAINTKKQNPIKLREFLSHYTLDMVLSALIPYDHERDLTKFVNYTSFVGNHATNIRNIFKWSVPIFIRKLLFRNESTDLTPIKNQMRTTFNEILLSPHQACIKNSNNFINSICKLRGNPDQEELISNADVFGDTNVLLFAAQDTVTTTFEFAIKLLCANPIIEEKLRAELLVQLRDQEFNTDNINKVEYLEMIIKETLRLYPPSLILPIRGVDKPFKLGNLRLAKGDYINISPYITQHLNSLWENPDQFIPERFSKENAAKIPAHAYIPFGDGRHGCAGWRFAYQQLKLLLAAIYMRYHVVIENNDFQFRLFCTTIQPKIPTMAKFIPIYSDSNQHQNKS